MCDQPAASRGDGPRPNGRRFDCTADRSHHEGHSHETSANDLRFCFHSTRSMRPACRQVGVHPHRTAGGDCHHRDSHRPARCRLCRRCARRQQDSDAMNNLKQLALRFMPFMTLIRFCPRPEHRRLSCISSGDPIEYSNVGTFAATSPSTGSGSPQPDCGPGCLGPNSKWGPLFQLLPFIEQENLAEQALQSCAGSSIRLRDNEYCHCISSAMVRWARNGAPSGQWSGTRTDSHSRSTMARASNRGHPMATGGVHRAICRHRLTGWLRLTESV